MPEAKQPKRDQSPVADRDEELDQALRELGDEVLNQEIPERLLRVLRSARDADRTKMADRDPKRNGS